MEQKDLETCLIIPEMHIFKLNIKLQNLQKLGDFSTPLKLVFFSEAGVRRRLIRYIEKKAAKAGADVAVTHLRWNYSPECIGYNFSLYKYK